MANKRNKTNAPVERFFGSGDKATFSISLKFTSALFSIVQHGNEFNRPQLLQTQPTLRVYEAVL